ncbi:hypothetical protein LTR16_011367, partial [Cryomyces antarcticus]
FANPTVDPDAQHPVSGEPQSEPDPESVHHHPIPATILRVGQITGPVSPAYAQKAVWNPRELLPSLIASSRHLRMLPESLGDMDTVDWAPVDVLADVVVEAMHAHDAEGEDHVDGKGEKGDANDADHDPASKEKANGNGEQPEVQALNIVNPAAIDVAEPRAVHQERSQEL